MATIASSKVASTVQPKGLHVGLVAVTCTYSLGASLSAGDVIQMIKVPAGATVVDLKLSSTGLTSTGSANVGDGISAARYVSAYLFSAGATIARVNTAYVPYTYSLDDTIDITVSAVSVSALAGAFNLTAVFSMDIA